MTNPILTVPYLTHSISPHPLPATQQDKKNPPNKNSRINKNRKTINAFVFAFLMLLARPQQNTLVHLLQRLPPPQKKHHQHHQNNHDAEGTNKGLDEGLLNPAPPLHDPPLPLFGFGDARPPPPLPVLHKEEEAEGGVLRLKQIGA